MSTHNTQSIGKEHTHGYALSDTVLTLSTSTMLDASNNIAHTEHTMMYVLINSYVYVVPT